jgi:glycosyltransferase involved in cell wall biosynthesis
MLSIIIPALNEEKYLSLLLDSIKKQSFKNYEIIVADAGSKDKTLEIARSYGCKIIKGGLPAKGRNEGAKIAKKDLFLFLDADVILPPDFLADAIGEFQKQKLGIATFYFVFSGKKIDKFFSDAYNSWVKMTKSFLPHAVGSTLLVRKSVHNAIGGFDEEIMLAEDHAYARKAKKIAKYGFLETQPVLTSSRRLAQEGRIKVCLKYILAELHMVSLGPIKSDVFKYKFDHYSKKRKN